MRLITDIVKGFALFCLISMVAEVDRYTSLQDIAEFFALMRGVGVCGSARLKGQPDGLHGIFLGVWDDPLYFIVQLRILLDKIIILPKHDLLLRLLVKKCFYTRSKALQDVHQRGDGRRSEIALDLGNKALGQLGAIRQLLLGQAL